MKTRIICTVNYHGNTEYLCKFCGRHLSGMRLATYEKCPKCGKKFAKYVKVVRK